MAVIGAGMSGVLSAIKLEERGVPATSIYVSMERNMKCGIALCGHCQFGAAFVCKDGPVFTWAQVRALPKDF
mgnify:CR=1 FL=1